MDRGLVNEFCTTLLAKRIGSEVVVRGGLLVNTQSGSTYRIIPGGTLVLGMLSWDMESVGTDWIVVTVEDGQRFTAYIINANKMINFVNLFFEGGIPAQSVNIANNRASVKMDWALSQGLVAANTSCPVGEFVDYIEMKQRVPEDFCHLHNHSTFSLLDGASTIEGVVDRAVKNGQPGIALTDHGFAFGLRKHYNACKAAGIKPVLGVEFYVVDDVKKKYVSPKDGKPRRFEYHQTVLAMNNKGWNNLCILNSTACKDHYYYVPRIDHELLFKHSEGLVVLSGCFKGMAAWHLQKFPEEMSEDIPWYRTDADRSMKIMKKYKQVFGDRYYGEVMDIDFERYMACVPSLLDMFDHLGIPGVTTVDCHYEKSEDVAIQSLMSKISNGSVGDGIGDDSTIQKGCYFIRSRNEIDHPLITEQHKDRTVEIMERCNVDLDFKGYKFPEYQYQADVDYKAYMKRIGAAA